MDKRSGMRKIVVSPSKAHCKGSKQIIKEESTVKIIVFSRRFAHFMMFFICSVVSVRRALFMIS